MKLKYLFTVEYTDGSVYKQNKEDKSLTEPETRSCFYDVISSGKKIKKFTLNGFFKSYSVDLTTGIFTLKGEEYELGETFTGERELIFNRQHQHDLNLTSETETAHRIKYVIGWENKEKKVKQIIKIN